MNKTRLSRFWLLIMTLSASCSKNSATSASPEALACQASDQAPIADVVQGLTRLQVLPKTAAACVIDFNSAHEVYPPQAEAKGFVSVFLPGTDGQASAYSWILQQGAIRGYHVIGLNYPNADAVNAICNSAQATESDCFGKVRQEILTGEDLSPRVAVDGNNSIEGRLLALLKYLAAQRPDEGWDLYFTADSIQWDKVYLAGHSQGSGHAALQAKRKALGRVAMYAGVSDYSLALQSSAAWMKLPSATDPSRYFGFIHLGDTVANFSGDSEQVTRAWQVDLGLAGDLVSVDQGPGSPAYQGSQRLTTTACAAYSNTVKHMCPISNGFQNVWNYISYP